MLPLLEGYDSIEIARLLQQTVSYLQESAQFLESEEQFKTVYFLQGLCNSFLTADMILYNEIEEQFNKLLLFL